MKDFWFTWVIMYTQHKIMLKIKDYFQIAYSWTGKHNSLYLRFAKLRQDFVKYLIQTY